jgi:hypothetical protein
MFFFLLFSRNPLSGVIPYVLIAVLFLGFIREAWIYLTPSVNCSRDITQNTHKLKRIAELTQQTTISYCRLHVTAWGLLRLPVLSHVLKI